MPERKKPTKKPVKAKPKWSVKSIEIQCVGIHHRLSISTRRYVKASVEGSAMIVEFKREPTNPHDRNAIAVYGGGESREDNPYYKMQLGYVPRQVAEVLAPAIDSGRAEFGISIMTSVDELAGTAVIEAKLRVRRNLRLGLDMKEIVR